MTTLEANKLIAAFLGGEVRAVYTIKGKDYFAWTRDKAKEYRKNLLKINIGEAIAIEQLKFDTDWNWLIPVIEKIEKIHDEHHGYFGVHICSNSCTIQGTNFRSDKIANPPVYFNSITLDTKIRSAHEAVIAFIQWYTNK